MKKVSTGAAKATKNFPHHKLTIGLDLGDRSDFRTGETENWSGRADLNCRPLAPQASALPG
jgi:hypothetical protein